MKKVILVLVGVSLVLMLTGFTLAAAGGFRPVSGINITNTGDYQLLPEPQNVEKTEAAVKCSSIELDMVNTKLEVVSYDGSDIKLDYDNIYKNDWSYSFADGKMKLENGQYKSLGDTFKSFSNFINALMSGKLNLNFKIDLNILSDNDKMHSVKLYLPKGSHTALNIGNVNGSVDLSGVTPKAVTTDLVNSSLGISDSQIDGKLKITDVNGEISIENSSAPTLQFDSVVNGSCTIDAPQFTVINAESFVNATLKLTGVSDTDEYSVKYSLVNGGVKIGSGSYSGNGSYQSGETAQYSVDFNGVNSNLDIGK